MIFLLLGFLFFYLCSADKTKGKNKFDKLISKYTKENFDSSFKISFDFFNNKILTLHIHHWFILLLIMFSFKNKNIKLLCLGGIIQGISCYKDWYKLLYFDDTSISPPEVHTNKNKKKYI